MEHWNPEWSSMPWKMWSLPMERYRVLPSFVIGEFVFIALALVTLVHACRQGRRHVATWVAAFTAGTANDAIFMMLPMVDNFWQAQACIMLTPRMPLYIPCVYNVFLYCGSVCAGILGLPLLAGSCLAGILGESIYSPYDITGAKFLWWTWHDTDAPIRERLLGVPIGSSVWVITFTCSFHFVFNLCNKKMGLVSSVAVTSAVSTPLMVVQMALLQLVAGDQQGLPTIRSLIAVLLIYSVAIIAGFYTRKQRIARIPEWSSYFLLAGLVGYYAFLSLNMGLTDPARHLSTGVHQEVGDCSIRAEDISGHLRQVFLCKETHQQDFSLECNDLCSQLGVSCLNESSTWYTVCGQPHSNYRLYVTATAVICGLAATVYTLLLTYTADKRGQDKKKKK